MGDFRSNVKIQFTCNEKTYNLELDWINYFPNSDGVDQRIVDFFSESWNDIRVRFDKQVNKLKWERFEKEKEEQDKREYERLKKKYAGREASRG